MGDHHPIPVAANLAVSGMLAAAIPTLLWLVCHGDTTPTRLAALAGFVLAGQSLFAVIHEAEHDKLHPSRRVNNAVGVLLGALFPGSFTILRAGHLAHHGRNRTDAELIDYYRPGERLVKTIQYYAMMAGSIWLGIVLLSVALCFLPNRYFRLPDRRERRADLANYLSFLGDAKPGRIRLETMLVVALWLALAAVLDLGWAALGAYVVFGVIWSSQQFIYHVRTPLHVVEGSWDLHMSAPFRWSFLNINYHLTHHRLPKLPWPYLPAAAEAPARRGYLATWARLFLPPRPYGLAWPQELMVRGTLPTDPPAEFADHAGSGR